MIASVLILLFRDALSDSFGLQEAEAITAVQSISSVNS